MQRIAKGEYRNTLAGFGIDADLGVRSVGRLVLDLNEGHDNPAPNGQLATALLAGACWSVLLVQLALDLDSYGQGIAATPLMLWRMAAYFTILTNTLMATNLSLIVLGIDRGGKAWATAVAMYATLLMLLYQFVLGGTSGGQGWRLAVDILHHYILPIAVLLHWVFWVPKVPHRLSDPVVWLAYPVIYFVYTLIRGHFTGRYPYDVLNVTRFGLPQVLANFSMLAVAYLLGGFAFVMLSRRMARIQAERLPA